ncbi:endonuclease I [Cellulophaga lytica]|uniref:endonuclease n=1 Tax=Cellulophaga lytica TaxID=979 RepID=UPI0009503E65|nr:endonuclease [Cellulophaga lytica]APU08863.1 endonuclease I [Cellulophaga lytica]
MMKNYLKVLISIGMLLLTAIGYCQVPAYYNGTDVTQTGGNLKTDLSNLVTTTQTTVLSYTPGVWDALKQTDLDPVNSNNVLLIYGYNDADGNTTTDRTRSKNNNGGGVGDWNREHVFPKSLGNPNLGTSGPGSDAHHLRSSDVQFNSLRNNHPFGDGSGNAGLMSGNVWYPGDEWKGDVARMIMYMYIRYGNQCLPTAVGTGATTYSADVPDIFLQWNAEDPVSQVEINRNVLLEGIQGNRNPFIDNPAFATAIWGGPQAENRFNNTSSDTEAPTAPLNLSAANTTETETLLSWDAATDNVGVTAYQIFNGTTLAGVVSGTSYLVTNLTAETTYTFTIKALDAAGNMSANSNTVTITTLEDTIVTPPAGDYIISQGYESTATDNWNYTVSPNNCNDGGSDVWDVVTSVGSISTANTGTNFFGIRDLEGNCGTADGGTLTFDAVDISTYTDVSLSFAVNVVGYDVTNGDTISYEIFHDGTSQGVQVITVGSPYSTADWEQITTAVPNTVSSVSLRLFVKQNGGSDYAGFDDVRLEGTSSSTPVTPSILINEIDADTPGTDTQEFVELFDGGAGNTPLDGLVMVLYNGSNNQSYAAYDLDGYTTDANGYFVIGNVDVPNVSLVIPSNGLQNGADAVVIYTGDASDFPNGSSVTTDNIVDAVVYDTNDSDDAELLVLLNAGEAQVNEGGAGDKDNHSSQRILNGAGGAQNTSTFAQETPTPGAANGEVVVVPPTEATILINELDADTAGTDTQEFVELFDGGAGNTALDGKVLVFYNGSNNQSYAAYDLDGYSTDANGYFVIGNADVPNVNIIIPSNGLQNGADAVALYTGDAADFPNNSAISTTNLLDALVYDTNDSDDAELLVLLNAGEAQMNEGGAGDKDAHSLQRYTNGSGAALSTANYVQALPTPGASNTNATEPITLVINEVDADTAGTDTQEFVELFDGGKGNTALDGFVLVHYNGSNNQSYAAYDLDGYTTNAEGYFVMGNVDVPNVSLVIPSNGLQNGADAVALYTGNASDFQNVAVTTSGLIDALVYDTNDSDATELLALLNLGEAQINEDELGNKDGHSLQRFPNGQGGARNTATYTQAIPSPGTENGAVIPPPATISIAEARNVADGEVVTVTGVLTVADAFAGSAYIQDATGAIAIFDELVHGEGVFMVGDSITVTGTRSAFNDQLQIATVTNVENNGTPTNVIEPITITLAELASHPAELVRIINPAFPKPGDILFGNSNYTITDASGNGSLRIDNDVEAIVGLGQPNTCTEITGVVGRFYETYQLLPRSSEDMPCAGEYVPPTIPVEIGKDKTLDVVAWNIEWFGDEANSPAAGNPMSDAIQKDSTKAIIAKLDADIYAVEEIADETLFAQMVSELPGYDYVLSPAVSYPNDPGVSQKLGFIYNTATVNVVNTKVLLQTIHPMYNGGDDSALVNYPSATDRFYASGRLPFLMTADVTINGTTEQINVVALHARANSGTDAQGRYDMRKYDVEVLKDTLDVQYADKKLILLGDYNDDVDTTVADITTTTTSSFNAYATDKVNYNIVSKTLSDQDLRSYVFRENMIDHITITNELNDNYIAESARVHYEFYDSDYPNTVSDHFPVSARFQLKGLELVNISTTDVTCSTATDGTATVVVEGGAKPYAYEWSNGDTTETATSLEAGTHSVIVTDALGNEVTEEFIITAPEAINISVSDNTKVYLGYDSCTTLSVTTVEGGVAPYSYEWSNGETTQDIKACPEATTTYTVTVTDANGCFTTANVTVDVEDVRCGNAYRPGVEVCYKGKSYCMSKWAAAVFVKYYGATLGACDAQDQVSITNLRLYPNPFRNYLNIQLNSNLDTNADFVIYNFYGRKVFSSKEQLTAGKSNLTYNLSYLRRGKYFLKVRVNGVTQKARLLIKR